MNPYAAAAQASSTPQEGNPRATEAWALTEAGRRLALAARGDAKVMREALRLNWRLWTIFQADLTVANEATPDNDVVINMLTLCQFVDRHTVDSLAEPTQDKLEVLVNLNRQIATGLLESLEREEQQMDAQAQAPVTASAAPPSLPTSGPYRSQPKTQSVEPPPSPFNPGAFNAIA